MNDLTAIVKIPSKWVEYYKQEAKKKDLKWGAYLRKKVYEILQKDIAKKK